MKFSIYLKRRVFIMDPDGTAHYEPHIRIHTVRHSVFDFRQNITPICISGRPNSRMIRVHLQTQE